MNEDKTEVEVDEDYVELSWAEGIAQNHGLDSSAKGLEAITQGLEEGGLKLSEELDNYLEEQIQIKQNQIDIYATNLAKELEALAKSANEGECLMNRNRLLLTPLNLTLAELDSLERVRTHLRKIT